VAYPAPVSVNVGNVVLAQQAQLDSVMLMTSRTDLGKLNLAPRQRVGPKRDGENCGAMSNPEDDMFFSYQRQVTFLDFIGVLAAVLYLSGIVVLWITLESARHGGASDLLFHVFLAGGALTCFGFVVSTLYLLFDKE